MLGYDQKIILQIAKGYVKNILQPRDILILAINLTATVVRAATSKIEAQRSGFNFEVRSKEAHAVFKLCLETSEADFATNRLSCKGRKGNALALRADEGRDKLR